ncbi:unannotated protein [freshwater metagenome]|uniref:Unannotated protein n=1 Tax=freshwater metagenome TaxID=449393 RepID=A0A6J6FXH3_9ZZZZ
MSANTTSAPSLNRSGASCSAKVKSFLCTIACRTSSALRHTLVNWYLKHGLLLLMDRWTKEHSKKSFSISGKANSMCSSAPPSSNQVLICQRSTPWWLIAPISLGLANSISYVGASDVREVARMRICSFPRIEHLPNKPSRDCARSEKRPSSAPVSASQCAILKFVELATCLEADKVATSRRSDTTSIARWSPKQSPS